MESTTDATAGLTTEFSKSLTVEQTETSKEEEPTKVDDNRQIDKEKAEEFKELGNKAFRGLWLNRLQLPKCD